MKLKKLVIAGVLALGAAGLLAGCGGDNKAGSAAKSAAAGAKPTKIVAGMDDTFAPMGFRDDSGKIVGFDIDMAEAISKEIGVPIEFKPIDWASKETELNSGRIDCIWNGMTATPERAESMSLSIPYLNNAQVLVVLADSAVKTIADMAGKTLSLQSGSSAADAVAANADLLASLKSAPVEYADNTLALLDLDNGGVDAVAMDVIVANYYIAKKGANYRVLDEQLAPEQYAVGFRKADVSLTDAVNAKLQEMAKDGKLAAISTEWFGSDVTIVAAQ